MKVLFRSTAAIAALLVVLGSPDLGRCLAASTTVEQALKLAPVQQGVDYDRPTPEEAAKCKISVKKDGRAGRLGRGKPRGADPAEVHRHQRRQRRRPMELLQGWR